MCHERCEKANVANGNSLSFPLTTCQDRVRWPHGLILVAFPQHAAQRHRQSRVGGEVGGGFVVDGADGEHSSQPHLSGYVIGGRRY